MSIACNRTSRSRQTWLMVQALLVFGCLLGVVAAPARTAVYEYAIPVFSDFSGPYADVFDDLDDGRLAVLRWWNETEGARLGIRLKPTTYDTRYDATVVASLWPTVLAQLRPIILFGLGGTDVAALQQRLPQDRVPMVMSTPGYGYGWLPNQWIFQPRATYVHEYLGFLDWFIRANPGKRPVRLAFISTQQSPAYVDIVKGVQKYVDVVLKPKGLAEVVDVEWVDIQPVDLSSQVRRIIDARADLIMGTVNTTMVATTIRALQAYRRHIPIVASPHHVIVPVSEALGGFGPLEGHYEVGGAVSSAELSGAAYEFYNLLHSRYGLKASWNGMTIMGMSQGLLGVRAIERAARAVGPGKLTGQALYEAFYAGPFTEEELFGVVPGATFTKEAPFPLTNLKVKIATVKDGRYVLATPGWVPVPGDVTKW